MVGIEAVTVPTGSKPVYVVEIQQPRLTDESRLDEIRGQILAIDKDATGVDILIDLSPVEFLSSAALGMLGAAEAETAFTCKSPIPIPLYWGKPWFMPLTTSWFGLQDLVGR